MNKIRQHMLDNHRLHPLLSKPLQAFFVAQGINIKVHKVNVSPMSRGAALVNSWFQKTWIFERMGAIYVITSRFHVQVLPKATRIRGIDWSRPVSLAVMAHELYHTTQSIFQPRHWFKQLRSILSGRGYTHSTIMEQEAIAIEKLAAKFFDKHPEAMTKIRESGY